MVREAFALLDLISFFTAGEDKEARAQAIRARHAAPGSRRRDPHRHPARLRARRGDAWDELVDAGGYAAAPRAGALRLEGRDYVMQDGDVMTVRFTP